jgi:hypothetical protein
MINRDISMGGPEGRREDVVLSSVRIAEALDHLENEMRNERTGSRTRWDREKNNIEGARGWNDELKEKEPSRTQLSDVLFDALAVVARICGFSMPSQLSA